jgi:hypothetical protein
MDIYRTLIWITWRLLRGPAFSIETMTDSCPNVKEGSNELLTGRCSSVSKMTHYGPDDSRSNPGRGSHFSLLSHYVQTGSGDQPVFYPMGTRDFFLGDKSAAVWSLIFIPSIRLHGLMRSHRNSFVSFVFKISCKPASKMMNMLSDLCQCK